MATGWNFVTGGSRGIGRAIVERLTRGGKPVVFTYLKAEEAAAEVAEIEGRYAPVAAYQCDGRDFGQVMALAQRLIGQHGAPHSVVNNAGITRDAPLLNMEPSAWADVIASDLTSSFNVTKCFLGAMMENGGGAIVQITSVTALRGNVGQTGYAAAKGGLVAFTRSLAREVGRFNVRVNAVAPGLIETEMINAMSETERRRIAKEIPLRRLGRGEDVAALTNYLISDDAAYVTGQTFVIDGGLTA